MARKGKEKVALISRIDFAGEGFRKGLLDVTADIVRREKAQWIVINGGLVSYKGWAKLRKERTEEAIELQKMEKETEMHMRREAKLRDEERDNVEIETQKQVRERVYLETVELVAEELAKLLPKIEGRRGKPVKYYFVSSPAQNYDGRIGDEIARRLEVLREDFIFWGTESARFPLQHNVANLLWSLNPTKAAWRSKYYSTSAQRIVEDKIKQSDQSYPDIFSVGTGGSALNKPAGGETPVQMITLPALHRLEKIETAENQVGVTVLEFTPESRFPKVRVYNLKDTLSMEREFIPDPEGADEMQLAILDQIRRNVPTIGMLADALRWKRSTIERAIKRYNEAGFEPGIIKDEHSGKYNFDPNYIQYKLKYRFPNINKLKKVTLLGFSCLHAGYRTTQSKWFVNRVPKLMAEHGVDCLVGCGDYIGGRRHNMDTRDELIPGVNRYTAQEELAGELVGKVLLESFKTRLDEKLSRRKDKSRVNVTKLIDNSLSELRYWRGNHDEWVQDDGYEPLYTMRANVASYLINGILEHLNSHDLKAPNVKEIVSKHIIYSMEHTLPTGVTMSIRHPHMGRMQTWSGRSQQTMGATKGQIVFIGNFHVSIAVHEWNSQMGQRLAMQIGSTLSGTDFESNMNKMVDTGVGISSVYSDPKTNKIFMTEVMWDSPAEDELEVYDSKEVFESVKEDIGL